MGSLSLVSAALTACLTVADAPAGDVELPDAFAWATQVPADVELLVHLRGAGAIRQELVRRPIGRVFDSLARESVLAGEWGQLTRELGVKESELFDATFGRSVTLASRPHGEWVVVTELGEQRVRDMMRKLNVRVREPRFGLAISELPEQDVLLASDGSQVVIGPLTQSQLFFDVVQRVGAAEAEGHDAATPEALARSAQFRQCFADLRPGAPAGAIAFIRHSRPLGGCSLIVADLRGDQVHLQHAGRFDNPPIAAPVTRLECDFSLINLFADRALLAIMQPRDAGDGPVESFLSAGLGLGLISDEMRQNLANRRLLVVGEQDARQLPEPADILTTTFVACLELKDAAAGVAQLDQQMKRLTLRLNNLGKGAFLIRSPNTAGMEPCKPRHADLDGAQEWLTGGFPVMKTVSLDWTVARGAEPGAPAWFVVGSNPQALDETVRTLQKPCPRDQRLVGKYDSCGLANGLRLGRHIESWSEEAAQFTDAPHVDEVRTTLRTFADLANGMQICRWQMERPTPTTMTLDVEITLSPPETAEQK